MIITRKHLPRRMFLQGHGRGHRAADARRDDAGVRGAAALADPKRRLRLAFTYVPNGITMAGLDAEAGEGAAFEFTRVMKPLEPFRQDTLVISGLAHKNGNALGDGPGDHARAAASYLTGVHPRKTAGADIQNGISVDQIAAQHLGDRDPLRLARARLRRLAHGRQLRLRLLLRLHQQPRLARPGDADAAGDQSAPRVRAAVRRHRHQPRRRRSRARRLQHRRSILDLVVERTTSLPPTSGRPIGASSTST